MDTNKHANSRGSDMSQQKVCMYNIEKENHLRLKWFKRNEPRLEEIANAKPTRTVPEEVKTEMEDNLKQTFKNMDRKSKKKGEDPVPRIVDENAVKSIMKPIDKEIENLIYSSTQNDGRMRYLNARIRVIPEERYYFPETTSFNYGWHMWNASKDNPVSKKFARQQVIKESFYRRRGVERDPDWYKEPAKLSPNVCGCI